MFSAHVAIVQFDPGAIKLTEGTGGRNSDEPSAEEKGKWGIQLYLDECKHVGLHGEPFWYGGLLNVLNLGKNVLRVELGQPEDVAKAQARFNGVAEELRNSGGGLISIYYHPCEFVHARFWDGVNFEHGSNPPRQDWKMPPMKSPAAVEQAFRNFQDFILFLKQQPQVQFVSGKKLLDLYPDRSLQRQFTRNEILALAKEVQKEITFQRRQDYSLSSAEIFSLLNGYLTAFLKKGTLPQQGGFEFAYGPSRLSLLSGDRDTIIDWKQFSLACEEVQAILGKAHQIPAEIWVASISIKPADYLATLGKTLEILLTVGTPPEKVMLQWGRFTADQLVAKDSPDLWDWVIFPPGFHSAQIMEQAALQSWTLKPAILSAIKK